MHKVTTREEARQYRYGRRASKPNGTPYREGFCAEELADPPHYVVFRQCSRKGGHGPDGLYCKQHAKRYQAA